MYASVEIKSRKNGKFVFKTQIPASRDVIGIIPFVLRLESFASWLSQHRIDLKITTITEGDLTMTDVPKKAQEQRRTDEARFAQMILSLENENFEE